MLKVSRAHKQQDAPRDRHVTDYSPLDVVMAGRLLPSFNCCHRAPVPYRVSEKALLSAGAHSTKRERQTIS